MWGKSQAWADMSASGCVTSGEMMEGKTKLTVGLFVVVQTLREPSQSTSRCWARR